MPSIEEVQRSLQAAWRLLRLDAGGLEQFTLTADGFWRSFFAIALVAPMVALIDIIEFDATIELGDTVEGASLSGSIASSLLRLIVAWVAAALAMLGIASLLDRRNRYATFIIAWNWISVPLNGAMLVAFLVGFVAPPGVLVLLWLTLVGATAFYDAFIARVALDVGTGQAIAVAAADLIVVLIVHAALAAPA